MNYILDTAKRNGCNHRILDPKETAADLKATTFNTSPGAKHSTKAMGNINLFGSDAEH